MSKAAVSLQTQNQPSRLREETLDRIERLLVLHEWDGFNRGLFSSEEMKGVKNTLRNLAQWLAQNASDIGSASAAAKPRFDETSILCIAYVDHIETDEKTPAAVALQQFFNQHLAHLYSHLHILPHFPSPTIHEGVKGPAGRADGGFEAMNYKMDPKFGTPDDLKKAKAGLMFDFVLNHLSAKGDLFQKYINNEPGYEKFFLDLTDEQKTRVDFSKVFRPREHNPIIPFTNDKGVKKNVWCTFSETQADINIKDPRVFNFVMEALVKDFIAEGAIWIRLDAIGYLVKMLGLSEREISTDSFGIEETHNILKAIRCYFSDIAPEVSLVPEVNATGAVIATYYGENNDEGHLVYDFPSAPISLYSIYREDASAALDWAKTRAKHPERIGLAFTNTHDGIGVLPMSAVADIEDGKTALEFFIHQVERRGGGVNYKTKLVDGKTVRIPYEACITWLQGILAPPEDAALKGNRLTKPQVDLIVDRFMASQSFVYSGPQCVPADYMGVVTSLLNNEELYQIAGHRRNKNRGLVDPGAFQKALTNPQTGYEWIRHNIYLRKKKMIEARSSCSAFSPYALCTVDVVKSQGNGTPVFSVLRKPQTGTMVLAMTNCTPVEQKVTVKSEYAKGLDKAVDILNDGTNVKMSEDGTITLAPYQVMWLKF